MELSKKAFGLTAGILWGVAIFLLTIILILKGTEGEHLSRLGTFYFGYRLSFLGSIIGLIWGFVHGFISGWLFAFIHNLFVRTS